MYCFFANEKKQAKQDWPDLPVLGSHSTKSSSSLEHSADETRSSDVGCSCPRQNNRVGRDRKKNHEQRHSRLLECPTSCYYYYFSDLQMASFSMNFGVPLNGSDPRNLYEPFWEAQWPKRIYPSDWGHSSLSHPVKSHCEACLSPDANFSLEISMNRRMIVSKGQAIQSQ